MSGDIFMFQKNLLAYRIVDCKNIFRRQRGQQKVHRLNLKMQSSEKHKARWRTAQEVAP